MDSFSAKEFKRLADEEPDAHVQYCNGIQYSEQPGVPGEDVYWVRKIYSNVSKKKKMNQYLPPSLFNCVHSSSKKLLKTN